MFFRTAGWQVRLARYYRGEDVDVLVTLHACKSADAGLAFKRLHPDRPLVVVLTGTDLYRDLRASRKARRLLSTANAIVTLQPLGLEMLAPDVRRKARSIVQSAQATANVRRSIKPREALQICVIGHLRTEKDPFRAARALRALPSNVAVRVIQIGRALDPTFALAARREMDRNARYRWLGERPRSLARRLLAESDAMVISSTMEGGANVLCEAIASGVPVLASLVPGNVGILGERYPGMFPVRDTAALAALLTRAANEPHFLERLRTCVKRIAPLVAPERERRAWMELVSNLLHKDAKGVRVR